MQPVSFVQRALLIILCVILVMPLTFCVLYRLPHQLMPPFLKHMVDRVANVSLAGMTTNTLRVPFNSKNWWNGDFQHYVESQYRGNFGFRRPALRLYNQLLFDVFRSSSMYDSSIVIGKHSELYEWSYVRDACGLHSPMAQLEADQLAQDLKSVQLQFEQSRKDFIVLITPSKAVTIPDNIPDRLCPNRLSSDTNYSRVVPLLDKEGIRFIDGQAITLEQAGLSGVPLFPLGGTHWGDLADYKVTEALVAEINRSRFGHTLPVLKIRAQRIDTDPRGNEADLLQLLNLARPNYTSEYLHIDLEPAPASRSAESLTFVGGSFTRGVVDFLVSARAADVSLFYYYVLSKEVWPIAGVRVQYPVSANRDFAADFLTSDVVVLEMNVATIGGNHVRSFLDDALLYFSHVKSRTADIGTQQ